MKAPSSLVVNVSGGVLLLATAGAGGWYGLGEPSKAGAVVRQYEAAVSATEREVDSLREALADRAAEVRSCEARLEAAGSLPRQAPVEQNLAAVTRLAAAHQIKLDEVAPWAPAEYPGIRELRYAVKGSGRFADWVLFFRDFEACSFWADITHVRLEQPGGPGAEGPPVPRVEVAISFFCGTETADTVGTGPSG